MSDTPRTDKAIRGRTIEGYGRIEWVEIDFARELERENAALRVLVKELERKLAVEAEYAAETHARHQGLVEQIAKLNSENATLHEEVVKANGLLDMQMKELTKLREDKERLDWLASETELRIHKAVSGLFIFEHNEIVWPEDKGRLREMIDAARKEAQS